MADRYYLQGPKKGYPAGLTAGRFVFDANVWLSVTGPYPDGTPDRAKAYSGFMKKIIEAGGEILVPQLIACEFFNKAVVIQQRAEDPGHRGKIHRAAGYSAWAKEASDLLNAVVSDNVQLDDGFAGLGLDPLYSEVERGGIEFHDLIVASLCAREKCVLVTDDADYTGRDIDAVTWNTRLT